MKRITTVFSIILSAFISAHIYALEEGVIYKKVKSPLLKKNGIDYIIYELKGNQKNIDEVNQLKVYLYPQKGIFHYGSESGVTIESKLSAACFSAFSLDIASDKNPTFILAAHVKDYTEKSAPKVPFTLQIINGQLDAAGSQLSMLKRHNYKVCKTARCGYSIVKDNMPIYCIESW